MMIEDQLDHEFNFHDDEINVYVVCLEYSWTFDIDDGIKFHNVHVSYVIKYSKLWLVNKKRVNMGLMNGHYRHLASKYHKYKWELMI